MTGELDAGLRERLNASLEEHRTGLRKEITEQGFDPDSDDFAPDLDRGFADSAHSTAERGRMLSLVSRLRDNLKDVEHALSKMERGTYGVCERCGDPIGEERLDTIPWARLCITCKQKAS
jgi:RNA polymerase-binding protein DksA